MQLADHATLEEGEGRTILPIQFRGWAASVFLSPPHAVCLCVCAVVVCEPPAKNWSHLFRSNIYARLAHACKLWRSPRVFFTNAKINIFADAAFGSYSYIYTSLCSLQQRKTKIMCEKQPLFCVIHSSSPSRARQMLRVQSSRQTAVVKTGEAAMFPPTSLNRSPLVQTSGSKTRLALLRRSDCRVHCGDRSFVQNEAAFAHAH